MTQKGDVEIKNQTGSETGFHRIDLIASLAIGLIVTGLVIADSQTARSKAGFVICREHMRGLSQAWMMYADLSDGELVGNLDGGAVQRLENKDKTWSLGWMSGTGGSPSLANTNVALIKMSPLFPYIGNQDPGHFRCPSDPSTWSPAEDGISHPRVRSYSMNGYIGERSGPFSDGYQQYRRTGDLKDFSPDIHLLFLGERSDSINDGWFALDMEGFDSEQARSRERFVDFPAFRHGGGANMSFVDGHVERWLWKDPRTVPDFVLNEPLVTQQGSPSNDDIRRLQAGSTRLVR